MWLSQILLQYLMLVESSKISIFFVLKLHKRGEAGIFLLWNLVRMVWPQYHLGINLTWWVLAQVTDVW